jgi:tetrahydromethanopterin S-methyltransferase subunit A
MVENNPLERIKSELRQGMSLAKCRKCGCMKESLDNLRPPVSELHLEGSSALLEDIERWLSQMEEIKYACLGCQHCFPAVALNVFNQAFPEAGLSEGLACDFEVRDATWPPVPGEYYSYCDGIDCPVAVSTLASVELVAKLAAVRPKGLCIVGKTETENIGIDKVIKNTITNPTIRFLVLAGIDPKGHQPGQTLLALKENGVDERMKVIKSPGKRPILRNVTLEEVETFRKQVQVVDMIGCEDLGQVVEKIREVAAQVTPVSECAELSDCRVPSEISTVPTIEAKAPSRVEMDRAGYFVIIPEPEKGVIIVEHYSYENTLLRMVKGEDARSLYWTVIENGWITQLSHAAYLGKELAKAELSIKQGFEYVQDGA